MTPLSHGVSLREDECSLVIKLSKEHLAYAATLESIADLLGIKLYWCDTDWPDRHGVYVKEEDRKEIWIPESTPFHQVCTFGHELHHALFAPEKECWKEMDRIEIARWEGKATMFGALLAMPEMQYSDKDFVRRAFGEGFEHYAHYRILHFEKHGW